MRFVAAVVAAAVLFAACSSGDDAPSTTFVTPDNPIEGPTISTTPTTQPTGFVAEDPVLVWLTGTETRGARDHLQRIGDWMILVLTGDDGPEQAVICADLLPSANAEVAESEAAARSALANYPVPGSGAIAAYEAVIDTFNAYLAECAVSADVVSQEPIKEAARQINDALAADRPPQ